MYGKWTDFGFLTSLQREAGVTEVKTIEDGCVEPSWVYKGTYWDAREKQSWENCPDIM